MARQEREYDTYRTSPLTEKRTGIVVTGGTLDKNYNPVEGTLVFEATHVLEILTKAQITSEAPIKVPMLKDSLDMTEEDRLLIVKHIQEVEEDRIVLTHGTDTMVETAQIIAKTIFDKTVILTGAMRPYSFGESDAEFNVGFAYACAQLLEPGVYIAMNGKVFTHDNVRKNKQTGRFEGIPLSISRNSKID